MKYNKVLSKVNLSSETKRYVNNYINESISMMKTDCCIEEFIWLNEFSVGKYCTEIRELLNKNIITFGYYNSDNILTPISNDISNDDNDIMYLKYMLSDEVLLLNGFKKPFIKEQ